MNTLTFAANRKLNRYSVLLTACFFACTDIAAPATMAAEPLSAAIKPAAEHMAQAANRNSVQSGPKVDATPNSKNKKSQNADDDDKKSKTENLQENFKTAKEAYEKVGAEILDGNYSKALDGAVDMAKDKMIEKAEDALKKKNETLYKAYKHGKDIKDDFQKGDYQAAWNKTKDAAYDEAKDYIEDKLIEKVIPGYGQLKGAWDAGYATGELIGQIPISADGRTVNTLAEEQMRGNFFGGQDSATSKKEAYNEVILALVKSVKKGEYKLPAYMTFSDAREIIQENMDGDRPPFEGFKAWAANELRDEDVVDTADTLQATPIVLEKPVETPKKIQPEIKQAVIPTPEEDDPWSAEPAPTTPIHQQKSDEPSAEPDEDIWAADDGAGNQLENERYRLQQQLDADKKRAQATADYESHQKFAVAEAKREEKARIKAEKARKFQEGMNALAQGLGQVAQKIQEAKQGGSLPQGPFSGATSSGKRQLTQAEKAAAIYRMCVQRTGDEKGCRSMASTGVKLDADLSKGKIPMDFIKKVCRDAADSERNYKRCISDKVAEAKRRMGQ